MHVPPPRKLGWCREAMSCPVGIEQKWLKSHPSLALKNSLSQSSSLRLNAIEHDFNAIFSCPFIIYFLQWILEYFFFIIYVITVVPAFYPFSHLHPAPPAFLPKSIPISLSGLCPCVMNTCSLVNPFTIFHPLPPTPGSGYCQSVLRIICFCFYSVH